MYPTRPFSSWPQTAHATSARAVRVDRRFEVGAAGPPRECRRRWRRRKQVSRISGRITTRCKANGFHGPLPHFSRQPALGGRIAERQLAVRIVVEQVVGASAAVPSFPSGCARPPLDHFQRAAFIAFQPAVVQRPRRGRVSERQYLAAHFTDRAMLFLQQARDVGPSPAASSRGKSSALLESK